MHEAYALQTGNSRDVGLIGQVNTNQRTVLEFVQRVRLCLGASYCFCFIQICVSISTLSLNMGQNLHIAYKTKCHIYIVNVFVMQMRESSKMTTLKPVELDER